MAGFNSEQRNSLQKELKIITLETEKMLSATETRIVEAVKAEIKNCHDSRPCMGTEFKRLATKEDISITSYPFIAKIAVISLLVMTMATIAGGPVDLLLKLVPKAFAATAQSSR
jgi:hypothetical protein